MSTVVAVLNGDINLPEPKQVAFFAGRSPATSISSMDGSKRICSWGDISIVDLCGGEHVTFSNLSISIACSGRFKHRSADCEKNMAGSKGFVVAGEPDQGLELPLMIQINSEKEGLA
ncbi:hypothetical protein B296_00022320 [Ensete ventricosum]|uniref:Uncharacterized protein n=1 Tax=Ensete ventricosum TaxID=4639 RepID=A0A426ZAN0_ENSVE|nr:hypothetical protein B296_00022320 [Ensete ventricosum]